MTKLEFKTKVQSTKLFIHSQSTMLHDKVFGRLGTLNED